MFTKEFWMKALTRAVRTVAESAIAVIGSCKLFSEVDWKVVVSTVLLSFIMSILLAIATGLPEVEASEPYQPKH